MSEKKKKEKRSDRPERLRAPGPLWREGSKRGDPLKVVRQENQRRGFRAVFGEGDTTKTG